MARQRLGRPLTREGVDALRAARVGVRSRATGAADILSISASLSVAVALTACAALMTAEAMRPLRRRVEPWARHVARNLATYGVAQAVAIPLRLALVVPVAVAAQAGDWGLLGLFEAAPWAEAAAGIVLLDATLWLWHVLNHRVGFLWRFHAEHHADLDVDASTALRFHFGELALSTGWRAGQVAAIGVSPGVLALWELLTLVATLFHHGNLALPERADRALARVVPTPRMHGIHHSIVRGERDSNFGILLSAWDALFGTLRLDVPQARVVIGLPERLDPARVRFWTVQAMPFRRRAGARLQDSPPPAEHRS